MWSCWRVNGSREGSEVVSGQDQGDAASKHERRSGSIKWQSDHEAPQTDPSFIQRWIHTMGRFLGLFHNTGWQQSWQGQRWEAIIPQVVTEGWCSSNSFVTVGHWCKLRHCEAKVRGALQQQAFKCEGAPGCNSCPTIHKRETSVELRKLLESTNEHVQAQEALRIPVNQWDAILVYWLLEKLDAESKKQFELAHPGTNVLTFKELSTFMDRRCRALESSGDHPDVSTPKKVHQEDYSSTVKHSACCQVKECSVIATSSWEGVRKRQWWGHSNCAWTVSEGIP